MFTMPKSKKRLEIENLQKLLPVLENMSMALRNAYDMQSSLDGIVAFFNATSVVHDKGIGEYPHLSSEIKETLRLLKLHLSQVGRDKYGMNRTLPGETVTPDNVYLGNVEGLFTLPIREWSKNPLDGSYLTVNAQAKSFMESHTYKMRSFVIQIRNYLSSQKA